NSGSDQPSLFGADARFQRRAGCRADRAAQAGRSDQALDHAGISRLFGRRKEVQITETSFAHAIRHDAGSIPRQVESAARLPDGGTQLCRRALAIGQANGPGPATPTPPRPRLERVPGTSALGLAPMAG